MKEFINIPLNKSDALSGKVIENTFLNRDYYDSDDNYIVITFTDGTFISIKFHEYNDTMVIESERPYYNLQYYSPSTLGYVLNNKFHYKNSIQTLIDLDVVEPLDSKDLCKQIIEHQRKEELREYKLYQSLKNKYEHYNPEINEK